MKVHTALCLAAAILLPETSFSQSTTTAVLSGTIADASGAVVPGAKAIATNPGTNLTRESSSDNHGQYRFSLLPPGTYQIRIEKQGFSASAKKIVVTVGQDAVLDFNLDVGAETQLVEISSDAPFIEVERTQQSSTINQRDGISLAPAATLPEKKQHADLCLRKLNLPFPALVDGMDGAAEAAYQAWPSRVYVIDRDGRVAYNSRLGELDFRPAALDTAISSLVNRGPDAPPR